MSPGWPGTFYVNQPNPKRTNSPASAFQVLRLKACDTMSNNISIVMAALSGSMASLCPENIKSTDKHHKLNYSFNFMSTLPSNTCCYIPRILYLVQIFIVFKGTNMLSYRNNTMLLLSNTMHFHLADTDARTSYLQVQLFHHF